MKSLLKLEKHVMEINKTMAKDYLTKKGISEKFSVPINTLNKDIRKMKDNPDFVKYIQKPSYRRLYINPDGYEEFLRFKTKERLANL